LPYLNCPNCRLTVYASASHAHREECPRCAARLGKVSRLFTTDLPHRLSRRLERVVKAKNQPGPTSA
jgi:ssDNA-binding Zn-finger/Zn-ribbon topoisomerase 1